MRSGRTYPLVALVILDGWGIAPPGPGERRRARRDARLRPAAGASTRTRTLAASGEAVGLPDGQMGNSEVGHLTIGSGRILDQDLQRVNRAIERRLALRERGARRRLRARASAAATSTCSGSSPTAASTRTSTTCGRCSSFARAEKTWIHAFTDGRDVSPTSAAHDLAELPDERIATVAGRYYAMDRDKRWERTQLALDAIVAGDRARRRRPASRPCRRATTRASRTSSSSRSSLDGPAAPRAGARRGDLLQLPPRPRAAALGEARSSSAST